MDGIEDVDDNRDQWTIALKLNCIDGGCTHKLHAICLSVSTSSSFSSSCIYYLNSLYVPSLLPSKCTLLYNLSFSAAQK